MSLYQLVSKTQCHRGEYVAVNGPFDRYGIVWKSESCAEGFLNLISGCPKRALEKPTKQF